MRLSLFLLLLCFAGIAKATNYYVDPSSTSSTANGSQATPWKTLSQVQSNMNSFQPGDFIYFKKGQTFPGTLDIKRSGTATAPITFTSYGSGTEMPKFTGSGNVMILVSYVQYVVIDGIKITDPTMNLSDHTLEANLVLGFYIDGSNYITVKNCDISLVGAGVNIQGGHNIIDHNSIQNLRMINNTPGGEDDYGAIPVIISGSDNSITNNFFKDGWGNSYDFMYDGGVIEMYGASNNNNKIMYNTAVDCDGFMEVGYNNGGSTSDNLVAYNKIINCGELVYISTSGSFATSVYDLQFYNNAIVNTINQLRMPNTMIGMSSTTTATNIIFLKNNVFWLTSGIDIATSGKFTSSQLIHEDNIYHLGPNSVLNYTANTTELSTSSPIFTSTAPSDPTQWDYMPVNNSPAIDFGQNLGLQKDFAGNTVPAIPNAGILESAAGAPTALTVTSTAGAINCNGGTTTVTVSASGGTTPYTGAGNFTVNAGTYTYTVTDAAGAVRTTSITITQPTLLVATASAGTITIYGATTSVTATASGGTSPYTYSINGGSFQSSNIFTGVPAGSAAVTIKDAKGCTAVKNITITQPSQVVLSSSQGTINCNGSTTTVTISATGGTTPYTGTGTFTVGAGNHTYTVTDAAGAVKTISVTITQPSAINATIVAPGVYYANATTTVTVTASGGTAGYTYSRDGGSYQSNNVFTNVAVGNHSIKVKDSKGCIATFNFAVQLLPINPLTISSSTGFINCNGGTTTVTITASGGFPPYSGTGAFTVGAGTATYTVTDASGAVVTKTITVVQPKIIAVSVATGTIVTYGGRTTATISATGGTGGYTYSLNGTTFQSSNTFTNLAAGNYTATVKDARNCTGTKNFTLTQPAQGVFKLTLVSKSNESCQNKKDGKITVAGSAGTLAYQYKLNSGTYSSNNVFMNLSPGSYTVTGKDATGATATVSVTINASQSTCTGGRGSGEEERKFTRLTPANILQAGELEITAYPNPSSTQFSVVAVNGSEEKISIIVMNMNGQKVYETNTVLRRKINFGNEFSTGVYYVKIIQGNNVQVIKLIKTK